MLTFSIKDPGLSFDQRNWSDPVDFMQCGRNVREVLMKSAKSQNFSIPVCCTFFCMGAFHTDLLGDSIPIY